MDTAHELNDLKVLMRHNYLEYASYVILERAIPKCMDGLKPVQRRILQSLFKMNDGKLHKVANVVGQTMTLHPHGDAPIYDALVNLANKGFLLDRQGNFGNLYTGDPASAARYIETRLSPLALETVFNPALTETIPSYDGRTEEPTALPAKIPLLLMQGADGIAVGMATKVLPHNFVELMEAEIAALQGKPFSVLPDFQTGGIMDASDYRDGRGKIKLRAKLDVVNDKTLVIREICHGTTTESLIRSIDEAAKKGRIRIDSISDFTAEKVEIEIKMPRGHYAEDLIDKLYAYTDCEVSLSSQMVVIDDNMPKETTVTEQVKTHSERLKAYLKAELEMERDQLLEKIFQKTLEQIFIENGVYKKLEGVKTQDMIDQTVANGLKPFHKDLARIPTKEDRERLLQIPIRRISRFDIDRNQEEIAKLEARIAEIEKQLKQLTRHTISYIRHLIKKFGGDYPRRTKIREIEDVDRRALDTRTVKVGFDPQEGFIGTHVKADVNFECTNFDKLLVMYADGSYKVINVPEKQYLDKGVVHVGIADKQTVMTAVYRDPKTKICSAKRFVVSKFILEKQYRFMEDSQKLDFLTQDEGLIFELQFVPKARQKDKKAHVHVTEIPVKGVSARGKRLSPKEVKKIKVLQGPPPKAKREVQGDLFEAKS